MRGRTVLVVTFIVAAAVGVVTAARPPAPESERNLSRLDLLPRSRGCTQAATPTGLPGGSQGFRAEPPRFADPARRQTLAGAFVEIDRVVRDYAVRAHIPGAAWGLVIDGELAHLGVAGTREVGKEAPVDGDTVFRIASMTKSFTAMAILSLRDEGRLSLDDPAERYVPELRGLAYPTEDAPRLTVRHLLSHAAGLPEDNPWGDQQLSATEEQLSALLRGGIPFSNSPGVAYEYSNLGFAILGRIVVRVSGVSYREFVTARILRPLGMASSTLEPSEVPKGRLAHGYRWEDETWKEEPPLPDGAFGSMGGMLTSVRDLSRYVGAFLDAWPPRNGAEKSPVRRSSLREMQQAWRWRPATVGLEGASGAPRLNAGGYGFGLGMSQTCQFDHVVAHSGGLPGFGSLMRWLPEYGVGFIAFGNRTYTGWGGVADQVFAMLAKTGGLQPREVQPSPALAAAHDAVSRLVVAWDAGLIRQIAAVNLFLDRSEERRRADFEHLRAEVGTCRADGRFEVVENPLRGSWLLQCERGRVRASVTLAPTMPPTVQYLEVHAVPASGEPPRRPTCGQ
ncbi:MAG TPA: serine hydrolase domain-containing protein [Vicinamibacterales bacterium]|jgi:CubicO group peptidase (beta-lactamase class C family)